MSSLLHHQLSATNSSTCVISKCQVRMILVTAQFMLPARERPTAGSDVARFPG